MKLLASMTHTAAGHTVDSWWSRIQVVKTMQSRTQVTPALLLCTLLAVPSLAWSETFSTQLAWEQSLPQSTVFTENFDDGAKFNVITDGDVIDYDNGLSLIGNGGGGLVIFRTNNGIFRSGHLDTDFESTTTQLIFEFAEPIIGFGFDYTNVDEPTSLLILDFGLGDLNPPPNVDLSTSLFFGATSRTPFRSFAITTGSSDQDMDIDNLRFAVVPVPAAIWMFGSALGILGGTLRRTHRT